MTAAGIAVTLPDDDNGWDRLGLVAEVRSAIASGHIRQVDGRVEVHPAVPAELRARMRRHRDVVDHVLNPPRHRITADLYWSQIARRQAPPPSPEPPRTWPCERCGRPAGTLDEPLFRFIEPNAAELFVCRTCHRDILNVRYAS